MASKYYDPVKAHEYYMKHRKLKGRKRKATTTKKGRSSKAKKPTYKSRTSTEGLNELGVVASRDAQARMNVAKKDATDKLNEAMKQKINDLKSRMDGMSDEEKKVEVEKIKLEYAELKQKVADALKEKFAKAMDDIKKNPEYK